MIVRVSGTSMIPFLPPGTRVLLGRAVRVMPGTMVAMRRGGGIVLHRVIRAQGAVLTQGDNLPKPDRRWPAGVLRGAVLAVRGPDGSWREPCPTIHRLAARLAPLRPGIVRQWALRLLARIDELIAREVPAPATRIPLPRSPRMDRFQQQTMGAQVMVHDLESGAVHQLNPLAHWIWTQARAGRTGEAMTRELLVKYSDVTLDQLARDVDRTLRHLEQSGLLPASHLPIEKAHDA